jgi:alkylation response protein AidB-like acyl-CoA dehydrogenase
MLGLFARATSRFCMSLFFDFYSESKYSAIQAHGGIGFTWEYDLHLYLRRAKMIQSASGMSESRAREIIAAV